MYLMLPAVAVAFARRHCQPSAPVPAAETAATAHMVAAYTVAAALADRIAVVGIAAAAAAVVSIAAAAVVSIVAAAGAVAVAIDMAAACTVVVALVGRVVAAAVGMVVAAVEAAVVSAVAVGTAGIASAAVAAYHIVAAACFAHHTAAAASLASRTVVVAAACIAVAAHTVAVAFHIAAAAVVACRHTEAVAHTDLGCCTAAVAAALPAGVDTAAPVEPAEPTRTELARSYHIYDSSSVPAVVLVVAEFALAAHPVSRLGWSEENETRVGQGPTCIVHALEDSNLGNRMSENHFV